MIPTVTEVVSSVVELLASVPRVVVDSSLDSELLPPPHAASALTTTSAPTNPAKPLDQLLTRTRSGAR